MAARSEHLTRDRLGRAATVLLVPLLVLLLGAGLTACSGDATSSDTAASDPPSSDPPSSDLPSSDPPSFDPAPTTTPTTTPTTPPAEGRLEGDGYALTLPEGWRDATEQFQDYSPLIDSGAVNATQTGQPFSDNVNVLRNADQAELPLPRVERQFAAELRTVASRVRVQERVTIDGVGAVHLTGRTETGDVVALTDQYVGFVGGASYVITFSYGSATPSAQRREEVSSMLASWNWG